MLGKLIKYEFKATGRALLPLYGAVILLALINKFFLGDFFTTESVTLGSIPQVIAMMVYVTTLIATFVVTFFVIIQRYRTNLLGDEGYLMNTLPVKAWQNITSKLIVACVWSVLSFVCAIVSIFILAYQKGLFMSIITGIPEFIEVIFASASANGVLFGIEIVLIMIIGGINSILMIYASLSIGSIFSKRKILASFGAFIVLNMISNIIATFVQVPFAISFSRLNDVTFAKINGAILVTIILTAIFATAYFIISNYILNKKLNLE